LLKAIAAATRCPGATSASRPDRAPGRDRWGRPPSVGQRARSPVRGSAYESGLTPSLTGSARPALWRRAVWL
jgi:hypothetical protein